MAIGEHAHELTIRSYRISSDPCKSRDAAPSARYSSTLHYQPLQTAIASDGTRVALHRGEIAILDHRQGELQRVPVPVGTRILFHDGADVSRGDKLCQWNPDSVVLLPENPGTVKLLDVVPGINSRLETFRSVRQVQIVKIIPSNASRQPRILIQGDQNRPIDAHFLADQMIVEVTDGQRVVAGDVLATLWVDRSSRRATAGFPLLQEIFSAGPTHGTAILAPFSGVVSEIIESVERVRDGKPRVLVLKGTSDEIFEVEIPGFRLIPYDVGEHVSAGDSFSPGTPVNPNDLFRILGFEAGVQHVLQRLRFVIQHNRISIDSKHFELIIRQMTSRVQIDAPGDTDFVAGDLIDVREYQRENDRVSQMVCITESETSEFTVGQLLRRDTFEKRVGDLISQNTTPPKGRHARPALAMRRLTSIQELARSCTGKLLFGKLDVNDLVRYALTEELWTVDHFG